MKSYQQLKTLLSSAEQYAVETPCTYPEALPFAFLLNCRLLYFLRQVLRRSNRRKNYVPGK